MGKVRTILAALTLSALMAGAAHASCTSLNNVSTSTSWTNFSSMTLKAYYGMRNRTASTVNAQLRAEGGATLCDLAPDSSCEFQTSAGFDNANDFERKRSSGGSATVNFYTCDTLAETQDEGGGED